MSRSLSITNAAREYVWLWDYRHGKSTREIASREHLGERRVREGISRAAAACKLTPGETSALTEVVRAPRLEPLFPIASFTPHSACAHRRELRRGSLFVCMVCHRAGQDGHPALTRDPRTDPPPEPKSAPPPTPKSSRKPTRKERRATLPGNLSRTR